MWRSSGLRSRLGRVPIAWVVEHANYLFLWFLFAWLKLVAFSGKTPVYTGDKRIWATIAEAPLFSREFLLGRRPLVYPLLFKAGLSDPEIIRLQVLLSILSQGLLAYALTRFVSRAFAPLIFVAVLLLGVVTPVNVWDLLIRAESTSNALLTTAIASALLFCRALPEKRWAMLACALLTATFGTAAAFARDTNPYIVLLLALMVVTVAWLAWREWLAPHRRRFWVIGALAVWLASACFAAQWTARAAPRYDFPLMNVIFTRILPHVAKRTYFVDELGMPMSQKLMSRSGKVASSDRSFAYREPRLQPFREWIFTRGYSSYQRYLLSHLEESSLEAYAAFATVAGYTPRLGASGSKTALTEFADEWLVSGPLKTYPLGACVGILIVGVVGLVQRRVDTRILGATSSCLVLATLSQLFVCFHGDSMDVSRHTVTVGILLRLAAVVACGVALNLVASGLSYLKRRLRRQLQIS